jgi:hypothetical protein
VLIERQFSGQSNEPPQCVKTEAQRLKEISLEKNVRFRPQGNIPLFPAMLNGGILFYFAISDLICPIQERLYPE